MKTKYLISAIICFISEVFAIPVVDYGPSKGYYNIQGQNNFYAKIRVFYEFNGTREPDAFVDVGPKDVYFLNVKQGGIFHRYIAFYTINHDGTTGRLFCHGEIKNWGSNVQVLDIPTTYPGQKDCPWAVKSYTLPENQSAIFVKNNWSEEKVSIAFGPYISPPEWYNIVKENYAQIITNNDPIFMEIPITMAHPDWFQRHEGARLQCKPSADCRNLITINFLWQALCNQRSTDICNVFELNTRRVTKQDIYRMGS